MNPMAAADGQGSAAGGGGAGGGGGGGGGDRAALNEDARSFNTSLRGRLNETSALVDSEVGAVGKLQEETRQLATERESLLRDVADAEDALKRHRMERYVRASKEYAGH